MALSPMAGRKVWGLCAGRGAGGGDEDRAEVGGGAPKKLLRESQFLMGLFNV